MTKMKRALLLIFISSLLSGCDFYEEWWKTENFDEYHVSIIKLIADPDRYHNKPVQVVGYVSFQFEDHSVCLHKEDSINGIARNCMWLKTDKQKCNNVYAIVSGRFNKHNLGHMGAFGGAIEEVERIWERHPGECRN